MKISRLLDKLPNWSTWWAMRLLRTKYMSGRTQVQDDVSAIVRRVMGDVLDWLRTTPNAVLVD